MQNRLYARAISPLHLFGFDKCIRQMGYDEAVERLRRMLPNGHEADEPIMTTEQAKRMIETREYPAELYNKEVFNADRNDVTIAGERQQESEWI